MTSTLAFHQPLTITEADEAILAACNSNDGAIEDCEECPEQVRYFLRVRRCCRPRGRPRLLRWPAKKETTTGVRSKRRAVFFGRSSLRSLNQNATLSAN